MSNRRMFVFLVAHALATGCDDGGEDVARTADFSAASSEQLRAVIEAASGANAASAYLAMIVAEIDATLSDNACPTRVYAGATMTLTAAGCTTEDGTTYDGRVVATNAITLRYLVDESPEVDPSRATSIEFEAFTVSTGEDGVVITGRIEQSSPTAPRYDSRSVLTLTAGDRGVEEDLAIACDGRDQDDYTCEITRGVVSIDGLGGFTAQGTFGRAQGDPAGVLDMLGIQSLHVELGPGPCHTFEIGDDGDDRGEICWDED